MYLLKVWIVWVSPSTAKPNHFYSALGFPDFSQQGRCEAGRKGGRREGRKEGWYQVPFPPGVGGGHVPTTSRNQLTPPQPRAESQSLARSLGETCPPSLLPLAGRSFPTPQVDRICCFVEGPGRVLFFFLNFLLLLFVYFFVFFKAAQEMLSVQLDALLWNLFQHHLAGHAGPGG